MPSPVDKVDKVDKPHKPYKEPKDSTAKESPVKPERPTAQDGGVTANPSRDVKDSASPGVLPPAPPEAPKQPDLRDDRRAREEETLKSFLEAWRGGDLDRAYEMLSSRTRSRGREQVISSMSSHPFRWALRDGYKVSMSGDSARVSATQRFLMVKMIKTETFRVVEEGGRFKVDWQ